MAKAEIAHTRDKQTDPLLTSKNCAIIFIDYQPEQVSAVCSTPVEEVMLNVKAVAKLARAYKVPTILTTFGVGLGLCTSTINELRDELPDTPEIDRTNANSWEDEDFRKAVRATGRKKIVVCGFWTETCCALPTLDMLREGFEMFPVVDAIGGLSRISHESAMTRMMQAGAQPISAIPFGIELMRNWAPPDSDELRKVLAWYFPERHRITAKRG